LDPIGCWVNVNCQDLTPVLSLTALRAATIMNISFRYISTIYKRDISGVNRREDDNTEGDAGKVVELAILGALKERPMHGYELKKRLSGTLGHFWSLSFGSLYPALKRLEQGKAIEKAYAVKEKTRNRYVYRITPQGEKLFSRLLSEPGTKADITDSDRFNLRMAFFRYMEPETRLWLLERRRAYLQDRLDEMKRSGWSGKEKETDKYRLGLTRHRIEITESDIDWLTDLIEGEKGQLAKKSRNGAARKKTRRKEGDALGMMLEGQEGEVMPSKV